MHHDPGLLAALANLFEIDPEARSRRRLATVAAHLDVGVFYSDNLDGANGRVRMGPTKSHVSIWIERRLTRHRQTQVLAHELAHVLLARRELYSFLSERYLDTGDADEESLCDALVSYFALGPQHVPVKGDPTLDMLTAIASDHLVPVSTVAERTAAARERDLPLMLARRAGTEWLPTRCAGLFGRDASLPRSIRVPELGGGVGTTSRLIVDLVSAAGVTHRLPCDVRLLRPDAAMLLIHPPDRAPGSTPATRQMLDADSRTTSP